MAPPCAEFSDPLSGDGGKLDPKEILGRSRVPPVGRMRLTATEGIQGHLARKKTPTP